MFGVDFASFSLWINLLIFALAAGVVWYAGGQAARIADIFADKTGLGSAFVGLLLLAIATSSPEISTTVTAAVRGNATLATNNLLGGIGMQTAILAMVDVALVHGALTAFTPKPVLLLQGVLLLLLLGLTLAGAVSGLALAWWGVGLWSVLIFIVYVSVLYLVERFEGSQRWVPGPDELPETELGEFQAHEQANAEHTAKANRTESRYREWSITKLSLGFLAGTLAILAAGALLAMVGDALATQTGLGTSFVGVTLLALATSLPEVSATITAANLGRLDMAVANIFGSNAFMLALLMVADIAYRPGAILASADNISLFAAATGVVVTAIYLVGMIERRDRTIAGMGIDSLAVASVYVSSLIALYFMR